MSFEFLTCLVALLLQLPCVDPDQSDHQLESESFLQHCAGAPTQRAPNTNETVRARETCPGTHIEVLQSVCNALQTELEKLEKCKTESSKQHKDMVCHPNSTFSAKSHVLACLTHITVGPPMINLQKRQSRLAYEREVDEIRKKYEAKLQTAEVAFLEEKKAIDSRYDKIFVNKAFVEALMQTDNKSAPHTQVCKLCLALENLLAYN